MPIKPVILRIKKMSWNNGTVVSLILLVQLKLCYVLCCSPEKDSENVWKSLTADEQKEFEEMTKDGRLGSLVEVWEPWWAKAKVLISW